jgi:hypothetical protein
LPLVLVLLQHLLQNEQLLASFRTPESQGHCSLIKRDFAFSVCLFDILKKIVADSFPDAT